MGKILVIAEKPQAGRDIAKALGVSEKGNGYLEGTDYIVTWAIGHLIELKSPEEVDEKYKQWNIEDLPLPTDNGLKVKKETATQFKVIKTLIQRPDIDMLINAGDAGREGYLIQSWIYRMAGNKKPIKVLWASSLTDEAIKKAFQNLKNDYDFKGMLEEAEARAFGDQKLGFNYSRLLTLTRAEQGTVLAYGRCQTPLLNMVVMRDRAIEQFISEPYYMVEATYHKGFKGMLVDEIGKGMRFADRLAAEAIEGKCHNAKGTVISYLAEEKKEKAPLLYSLDELQIKMGKKYGFTPDYTLAVAQNLYEKHKIMSYPRTDSQYLTSDLFNEIGQHLMSCNFGAFQPLIARIDFSNLAADKSYFNDGKVTDHHALIPTINSNMEQIYQALEENEKRVFDEVVFSIIAIFYPAYSYLSTQVTIDIKGAVFLSSGTTIKRLGYKEIFSAQKNNSKEGNAVELQILPELKEGDLVAVDNVIILDKKTVPPKKYTPATLIKIMKKYNIGTTATRAEIVKKLQTSRRQYMILEKGKYSSTDLGREFIDVIPNELKSPQLTMQFEDKLQQIGRGELCKKDFLQELDKEIKRNIELFAAPAVKKIGTKREEESIGTCPVCQKALYSGKKNYYCSGYKAGCKFVIWKTMAGKTLADQQIRKLLEAGQTGVIKGFTSKNGSKFSASLKIDSDKKIVFNFEN